MASAATIWCLQSAGLLAPNWCAAVLVLLLVIETWVTVRKRPLPKYTLPGLLICSEIVTLCSLTRTDVTSVRPFGAQTAAITLVLFSLAGPKRRDLLTRLVLAAFSTALAVAAGGRGTVVPAGAVALACGYVLAELERPTPSPHPATVVSRPAPQLGRGRLLILPLVLALAVASTLAATLSLPQHRQPLASLGTPDSTYPDAGGSGNQQAPDSQGRLSNVASSDMDLRTRGTLPDTPVARIRSLDGDSEPELWRAATLMIYDGASWKSDGSSGIMAETGSQRRDTVTPLVRQNTSLLSPGTPISVAFDGHAQPAPQQPASVPPVEYTVRSLMPNAAARAVDTTPVAAPATDPAALQLPDIPARVYALSQQLTEGAATRRQAVDAVVTYLRQHEAYKLDSPVPAEGEDAVDDFLFRDHTGFCEQFASAAAVLLRASDVPTRIVTGYASGDTQPDGSWLIRAKQAHAWIEVEYPGVGWLPVDPTAGVALAPASPGHSARSILLTALVVVGLAVLAAAVLWFVRRRRRRHEDPIRAGLANLDAALGPGRRGPTESLRDLAARVALRPAEVQALATAERSFFGSTPLPDRERSAAAAALRRTARRIRRDRLVPGRKPPG